MRKTRQSEVGEFFLREGEKFLKKLFFFSVLYPPVFGECKFFPPSQYFKNAQEKNVHSNFFFVPNKEFDKKTSNFLEKIIFNFEDFGEQKFYNKTLLFFQAKNLRQSRLQDVR